MAKWKIFPNITLTLEIKKVENIEIREVEMFQ